MLSDGSKIQLSLLKNIWWNLTKATLKFRLITIAINEIKNNTPIYVILYFFTNSYSSDNLDKINEINIMHISLTIFPRSKRTFTSIICMFSRFSK